jgi:protein O-GlcNAc transferase
MQARINMLHALPHHRLLALHTVSDVVLDSYAAGGCTTTREALELGKVVVTLPAKFLGGRWSLAYYSIMGVLDFVVQSKQQYVELAVRLGTDASVRAAAEQKIKDNVHKLFFKEESVAAWTKVLSSIAPPPRKMCSTHHGGGRQSDKREF